MYFTRMHQERSYVLALEGAGNIEGMYIGSGPDALSFRQYGKYLLIGGKGSPDRRKQRGRKVRRTEKQGAHPVPWEQGNRLLVGAGLHNSGSDPVYRTVCAGPSALVCRFRISEVGHDFLHGLGNDSE